MSKPDTKVEEKIVDDYQYGFSKPEESVFRTEKGLDEEKIKQISAVKKEPEWMLKKRLDAYRIFLEKKMPEWGADLSDINFDEIFYYLKPTGEQKQTWEELPDSIKDTYDRLGIPEAERKFLAGVSAQYESEVVYHSLIKELEDQGVIFTDMDTALREHEALVKEYFGTLIPAADNKFAALNTSVWSGGSFVYIPKGVKVTIPLQAYFRINAKNMGQFERTLIIAEEDSFVHYIEGCFLAGAKVRTKTLEKNIEDIEIGDEVLTHKGSFKKVTNVLKRNYSGKIHKIRIWGNSSVELKVTPEHPIFVSKRERKEYRNQNFKREWTFAENLETGDYLIYPKRKLQSNIQPEMIVSEPGFAYATASSKSSFVNEPFVNKYKPSTAVQIPFGYGRTSSYKNLKLSLNQDFFRLLGYFLAEGHVDKEHYLTFTFHEDEKKYLQDVKKIIKELFQKDVIEGKVRNHGITLTLCDTKVARFFAKEFGSKISDKKLPNWIFEAPDNCLKELIKGMWLEDGSFDEKRKLFRFNTISKNLAQDFQDILLNFGIIATINLSKRKSARQDIYTIVISRLFNEKFGEIVGEKVVNGKKEGSPFFMDENFLYLPIKSIETEEVNDFVYNLSVEEDETYVAEGVISHNCTAPVYSSDSLHSAVVEIFCKKNSRVRYTTVQNWAPNVYNLVTKRAVADEGATMEWIDGNIGSKKTMKYPSIILRGENAKGVVVSAAYAGKDQHQDTGTKIFLLAPNTSAEITAKSVSQYNGKTTYRGIVSVSPNAKNTKVSVKCDALLLDQESTTDTIPVNIVNNEDTEIEHEASVSRMKEIQLQYLQSRGISEDESSSMVVNGFMDAFTKELPMEYAVELNRLIAMNMEGSVG